MLFEFIKVNILNILLVALFIGVLLFVYRSGKKDLVKEIVLSLVIQAEKTLGSGTGELKYAMVVERFHVALPRILKFLFTKQEIDTMIEEAVTYLKNYLSDGKNLLGYGEDAGA